jgi:hypothetical protein
MEGMVNATPTPHIELVSPALDERVDGVEGSGRGAVDGRWLSIQCCALLSASSASSWVRRRARSLRLTASRRRRA